MTFENSRSHKRTTTTGIVFAMAASILASTGCGGAEPEDEVAQVGSALGSNQPQQFIDDWDDLTNMVSGGNYLLRVNLNAAGRTWNPIHFTGTFDGGDKILSNLTVNSTGSGAGFFKTLNNAIVRRVRFTNLKVTDSFIAGGIASTADNSLIELVGVQGTISSSAFQVGGLFGSGYGTTIRQSFVKGTVSGGRFDTGGLVGHLGNGTGPGLIYQSYVWADVTGDAPVGATDSNTGGLVGTLSGARIQEAYAVGKVTGRYHVGGLAGHIGCNDNNRFVLNHGIFRGDVIDQYWTPSGGWSGTFGTVQPCPDRFDQNIWDSSRDPSTNAGTYDPVPQKSATNGQLTSPTTVSGGVYNYQDNKFVSSIWEPGSASQHHALKDMPGGLTIQPRCVNASGVPYAC